MVERAGEQWGQGWRRGVGGRGRRPLDRGLGYPIGIAGWGRKQIVREH